LTGTQHALYEAAPSLPHMLDEGARWYAVHTLPFSELRAREQLGNQGFRTFLPKRRKTVRHARKLREVEAPFFPRYLFVVLDMDRDRWRSINGTFGVSSLVMQGNRPHPIPRGVVEALIASVDARGILHFGERLKVGGTIRLLAGAFAEQLATLESVDDSGRIRVLLDVLGRKVSISTDRQHVFPIA
jgi:transcription elongation factor/antiterminator RfaH